jgi:hypothetical protein
MCGYVFVLRWYRLVWGSSCARVLCLCVCVFVLVYMCFSICLSDFCVRYDFVRFLCVSFTCVVAATDGRCVVALWYTLAIYLVGAGTCEFEYVYVDKCLCCGMSCMGWYGRARARA